MRYGVSIKREVASTAVYTDDGVLEQSGKRTGKASSTRQETRGEEDRRLVV